MVAPPKPQRIALGRAVDLYLDSVSAQVTVGRLRQATRDNYANDLRNFVAIIGADVIADDVSGSDVDQAVATFGAGDDLRYRRTQKSGPGRTVATQKRFYESITRFFNHAAVHGWVQVSPMPWVTLKPKVRGDLRLERTALTAEQATALLEHGPGSLHAGGKWQRPHERNHVRDRLILTLLVVLGPRVDEVSRSNRSDVTLAGGGPSWRVVGKSGKVRRLPLSPDLVGLINDYLAVQPPPRDEDAALALFRTGRGARLSARDVQRLVNRATVRVQQAEPDLARGITPHALRHTAATLMLASGWDVKVVSQLLGHANLSATQRYLDTIPGELADAIQSNPLLATVPQPA